VGHIAEKASPVLHASHGHSIGRETHGNGANLDNFETHDERSLIPWTCFSSSRELSAGVRRALGVNVFLTNDAPASPAKSSASWSALRTHGLPPELCRVGWRAARPARAVAGGTVAPPNAARTAQVSV